MRLTNRLRLLTPRPVSIHAPTGGATATYPIGETLVLFQSTHPLGVRHRNHTNSEAPMRFNPRTHWGCDGTFGVYEEGIAGFNPRTHWGCDAQNTKRVGSQHVSIHAPTGGATDHTLMGLSNLGSFNPRTHWGCDITMGISSMSIHVSIHAPTGGATLR